MIDRSTESFEDLDRILAEHYRLGRLTRVNKLDLGLVNISYEIETVKNQIGRRYLLRWYNKKSSVDQIRFEHALLAELSDRGFTFSPHVIRTRDGSTFVSSETRRIPDGEIANYAVFSFLSGWDKYSWDHPDCLPGELGDAARVLARYHQTISGWEGTRTTAKPYLIDLLPGMTEKWERLSRRAGEDPFDLYFLNHLDKLASVQKRLCDELRGLKEKLPKVAVHGDYHPGNLKFKGGRVIGVFDFDWTKIDLRLADVAIAVMYFCAVWEGRKAGTLSHERFEAFIRSYQAEASKVRGDLGPLSDVEMRWLPRMIQAAAVFVLDWVLDYYYEAGPDPGQCLRLLRQIYRLSINSYRLKNGWL